MVKNGCSYNNQEKKGLDQLFPSENAFFWKNVFSRQSRMNELRIRVNAPAYFCMEGQEYSLDGMGNIWRQGMEQKIFPTEEVKSLLLHLCRYSIYAFENEFREGFITLEGGHRLGVAGQVVQEEGRIRTIRNISFLNLRIAHEIKGAADRILPCVCRPEGIKNTLIVAPPGCGKTTLLRDLIRQISTGTSEEKGKNVGVVDERCELSGSWCGVPQNDLGPRTDVMCDCSREQGLLMLLRSMSPQVLAVDEIGKKEELEALSAAGRSGVSVLATLHGRSFQDGLTRGMLDCFDCVIILARIRGKPLPVEYWERKDIFETAWRCHDLCRESGDGISICEYPEGKDKWASGTAGNAGVDPGRNCVQQTFSSGMLSVCGGQEEK